MEEYGNIYDLQWNPQEYLRQYYSQDFIPDDEEAIYQRVIAYLQSKGRTFTRALEFGCGPTVHHLTPLMPWVEEIHLADYLSANLQEVGKWLWAEPDAHDWDINIRRALEIETQSEITKEAIEARKELIRSKVTALKPCDARRAQPLGDGAVYDLVFSAYCVDAATDSKQEWRQLMSNLLRLCADDGVAIIVTSHKAQHYLVGSQNFPFANIDECDLSDVLVAAEFQVTLETVTIKDWTEAGFDGIVIAIAEKAIAGEERG